MQTVLHEELGEYVERQRQLKEITKAVELKYLDADEQVDAYQGKIHQVVDCADKTLQTIGNLCIMMEMICLNTQTIFAFNQMPERNKEIIFYLLLTTSNILQSLQHLSNVHRSRPRLLVACADILRCLATCFRLKANQAIVVADAGLMNLVVNILNYAKDSFIVADAMRLLRVFIHGQGADLFRNYSSLKAMPALVFESLSVEESPSTNLEALITAKVLIDKDPGAV